MVSEAEKQEFKTQLLEEQARLERELATFTKEFSSAPGGHEAYIEPHQHESNPDDEAQIVEEYQRHKALEKIIEKRLEEIAQAVAALETDKYGSCVKCGVKIPLERLQVNPAALTCFKCAS